MINEVAFNKAVDLAVKRLDKNDLDNESAHSDADEALIRFVVKVAPKVAAAHARCVKRTGPWWYA